MITIFQQLSAYYEANPSAHRLDHVQKSTLGRQAARVWYGQNNRAQFKDALVWIKSEEDTGTFRVLSYPDYFKDDIDKLIVDYYASLAPRRQRERKIIRKPVWTVKPS